MELLDESNVIQLFERYQLVHSLDPFLLFGLGLTMGSLILFFQDVSFNNTGGLRIRKWSEYSTIERRVNTFLFVFMLIITKNIEHVL